jgi:membrane protein DedA with SNARE-associated domain
MESLLEHLASLTPGSVYLTLVGMLLLCGLGLPFPEDISLLSAGYLAHLGVLNVNTAFVACLAAVLGGDGLAFFMGRYFGPRILKSRLFQKFFTPRKQLRVRAYFRKFGSKVIFIARFLPGLRFSIFFSAGTLRLRPTVFFVYDSLAAMVSVPVLVYMAWHFGDHIDRVISWSRRSGYGILAGAALLVAVLLFKRSRRKKASRPLVAAPPLLADPKPIPADETTAPAEKTP